MAEGVGEASALVPPPPTPAFLDAIALSDTHRQGQRHSQAAEALLEAAALQQDDPRPHFQLAMAQTAAGQLEAATRSALRAVELAPAGHLGVLPDEIRASGISAPRGIYPQLGLRAAIMAFDLLSKPVADAVPRPNWWNDKELLRMSERALQDSPESQFAVATRVRVLMGVGQLMADGSPRGWYLQQRTPPQLRELARLLKKQATFEPAGSLKAVQQLRNAATILEKAMEIEQAEREIRRAEQLASATEARIASASFARQRPEEPNLALPEPPNLVHRPMVEAVPPLRA